MNLLEAITTEKRKYIEQYNSIPDTIIVHPYILELIAKEQYKINMSCQSHIPVESIDGMRIIVSDDTFIECTSVYGLLDKIETVYKEIQCAARKSCNTQSMILIKEKLKHIVDFYNTL